MKRTTTLLPVFAALCLLLQSCILPKVKDTVEETIEHTYDILADQYFKTAIALIELSNIRNGKYPERLSHIKFKGPLDTKSLQAVSYLKLDKGYQLDLSTEYLSKAPSIDMPNGFWKNLGCKKSNLK